MENITSRNNHLIKVVLQLKQKKYRDRYDAFLLEGLRSAEDACLQGITDCIGFISEEIIDNPRLNKIMDSAELLHWQLFSVTAGIMKLISGTEHGQGIMVISHKKKYDWNDLLKPLKGHYVILDSVQDPGNMGTILRTAAAAGVHAVILTEGCTDAYAEKVVRSSMGSILRIPVYEHADFDFLLKFKNACGIPFYGTSLHQAVPYKNIGEVPDGVFVFGNEGNGIRPEILNMTDKNLYIPLQGSVESLNVSIAAAVILFHFS
ncbi:RNA methyltransferase [uncultured Dialister sp.]|uniref:TrmH family RNA methyltransferase n=1 Tax=uncultured Dialister sp. TaxID=278064 RepID=UPI0025E18D57|nr:RNA methyltransferase [uncultured Dialister sp.]